MFAGRLCRCLLLCKDKNFKANHNYFQQFLQIHFDVCYYAKIRILKQITTCNAGYRIYVGCLLLCKDKNFKANHNLGVNPKLSLGDVCYYAKIRILRQIIDLMINIVCNKNIRSTSMGEGCG